MSNAKTPLTSLTIGHLSLEGLGSFGAPEADLEKTVQAWSGTVRSNLANYDQDSDIMKTPVPWDGAHGSACKVLLIQV